jgi:hypothetical protein
VGRKNYLFAGSDEAARRTAVLYSIIRSCARHKVAPQPYLTDVLRRLRENTPAADLLPDRWQQRYAATIIPKFKKTHHDQQSASITRHGKSVGLPKGTICATVDSPTRNREYPTAPETAFSSGAQHS